MEPSDAALVERCLGGQKEAFGALVRRHQDAVFHLALRWSRDRDEAADVAQDAFLRAFRKLGTYQPQYSFRNWVLTICASVAKNRFRSDGRRRQAQDAHVELYPRASEPPDGRRQALGRALAEIPETLRVPLVLKHVEGLSYEEVSGILGIGVSAAKMRVKRGRDELVRRLGAGAGAQP
ncbi:MAG: RNA polymerase sigma factor [Deferrisomatales bacterium]